MTRLMRITSSATPTRTSKRFKLMCSVDRPYIVIIMLVTKFIKSINTRLEVHVLGVLIIINYTHLVYMLIYSIYS